LNEVYWSSILKILQSLVLLHYIYMPCMLSYVLKYIEILSTKLWIIFKILNQYTSFDSWLYSDTDYIKYVMV
jgi:hypothetical protein